MWTWDLLTTTIIFPNFPHISRSLLRGSEQNDGGSGRFQVLRRSQTKACCPIEHTWKCPRRSGGPVGWSLMTWMMVLWCLDISGYPILWLIRIPIIIIGSIVPNQSIMVSLKPSIIPMDLNHQLVDGFYIPKNNPMKFTVFLIFTKSHITPISWWFIGDNVNPGLMSTRLRLFDWVWGTIKKYQMKWLLEEYPLIFINHGLAKSGVDITTISPPSHVCDYYLLVWLVYYTIPILTIHYHLVGGLEHESIMTFHSVGNFIRRAIYFWIFVRGSFFFWGFLVLCFPVSLIFCFFAFLLLCFSASLLFLLLCFSASLLFAFPLLCFSCFSAFLLFAFPASLLFCFSVFPGSLLFFTSVPFYFYYSTFSFLQSCVFAALLPAPLLLCFLSLLSLCFSFSFALFWSVCIPNETLERP